MMSKTLKLLVLILLTSQTLSQRINPCLYNREDFLPCIVPPKSGVALPDANQYTVHATRFRRGPSGYPLCVLRKDGELVADIEDLGSTDVKFLFSPGAERSPNINYANQMLAEYNVQCKSGKKAFIQFDALDLEPQNCFDGYTMRCQDYIEINTGVGGVKEYCGSDLPNQAFTVGTGHFTLKLRTSFFNSYSGFRIFVTCFKEQSTDISSCTASSGKSGTTNLVDLSAQEHTVSSTPISLTSSDKKTVNSLMSSLYSVAFSQARRKIISWPPPSFSQNEPGDILDLSELDDLVSVETTSSPIDIDIHIKDPDFGGIIDEPIIAPVKEFRRKKRTVTDYLEGGSVHLDSKATLEAVRYENACNPIIKSITSSYLTVAQRLEPTQVQDARQDYQQELSLHDQTVQSAY